MNSEPCAVCNDTGKWAEAPAPCPICGAMFVTREYINPPIPLFPRVVEAPPVMNRKARRALKVVK